MRRSFAMRLASWFGLPLGVVAAFFVGGWTSVRVWRAFGPDTSPVSQLAIGVMLYVVAFLLILVVERTIFGRRVTKKDLGLDRSLLWKDIGYGVLGFIAVLLLGAAFVALGRWLFPALPWEQVQETGFSPNIFGVDRLMAFLLLVVMAPVAEETVFRGYLFNRLQKARMPLWLTIIVVSLVFALIHLQLNVGVVVFALSVVAMLLRWRTGSIWSGIILHGLHNLMAFYVIFITH